MSEYEKARALNDEYRTVAMNRKYYACRLASIKRLNLALEILIAVGTSGAVAAWTLWKTGPPAVAWKVLAAVATLLSVIKPFLNLGKEIERYSELVVGYAALLFDLDAVILEVRTSNRISDGAWQKFLTHRERTKQLGIKDDLRPKVRLHRRCYSEINHEIPARTLWWPSEES